MFVVMIMQKFEFEQKPPVIFPYPIVVDKGKMIGYLPCYETREDALKDCPDGKILEAKYVEGEI